MSKNYAKRDFKKRSPTKQSSNLAWLWLVTGILIGGFGFSLFFLKTRVTVVESGAEPVKLKIAPTPTAPAPVHAKTPVPSSEDKTSYDFYTMLPNTQPNSTSTHPTSKTLTPAKPLAEAEQTLLTKNTTPQPTTTPQTSVTSIPTAAPAPAVMKKIDTSIEPTDLSTFKNSTSETKPTKKPLNLDDGTRYTLVVGSFDSYEKADTRKAELTLAGFTRVHIESSIKNETTWHRVLIGPYKNKNEAESIQKNLEEANYSAQLSATP